MSCRWYFSHEGRTYGPFSEKEIEVCIARKLLLENDRIWPEGRTIKDAAPASVIFDFPTPPADRSTLPDWLADVALMQRNGPLPPLMPTDEIPEWLEDLRLWWGLDWYEPVHLPSSETTPSTLTNPNTPAEVPDWLASWMIPAKPKTAVPMPPTPMPPPPAMPVSAPPSVKPAVVTPLPQPSAPPAVPAATPLPYPIAQEKPTPALAAAPMALIPSAVVRPTPSSVPRNPVASPPAAPLPPSAPPTKAKTIAPNPANFIVRKTRYESGFDLETGQIVDPEKFRKWRQQQAPSTPAGQPAITNAGSLEVFRKARFAIESWADEAASRACIMQGDIEQIKRRPEIQAILREFASFGDVMQEKLLRHLAFIVENRRKYYLASQGTGKGQ